MDMEVPCCDRVSLFFENYRHWSFWRVIILGQVLSLLLCALTYMTHYIASEILLHIPTGQNYLHYMFLCSVFTTILACRKGDRGLISVVKSRGYRYILIGFIDVQANTLLATAHQFTTLTSIHLLDCVSIPVALALSCLTLGIRFRFVHIFGVSMCLLGVGCLVWADIGKTNVIDSQNQLVGDMLCLGGAVLFAVVTVLQELVVKTLDCVEYLGMLGLTGSIICGAQTFLLERSTLTNVNWEHKQIMLYMGCFSIVQFIFYGLLAYILKESSATAVQLYLLTADFYTLLLGVLWKNIKYHTFYLFSFFLVVSGILIFAIKKIEIGSQHQNSLQQAENNRTGTGHSDGQFIGIMHSDENNLMNYMTPEEISNSNTISREYGAFINIENYEMNTSRMIDDSIISAYPSQSDMIQMNTGSTRSQFSSFYGN